MGERKITTAREEYAGSKRASTIKIHFRRKKQSATDPVPHGEHYGSAATTEPKLIARV
jgi:hypothetical protein